MVCDCTGLPPGELMRRITPCVFLSLNAACSEAHTFSAVASPAGGLIGRAVRRAEQLAAVEIEKYSFLPVEFHRDMRATVEISMHPPPVADHKGGCRLAEILDLEAHAGSRIRQRPRGADQPCCASHSLSSVTLPTQPRGPQERRLG